MMRTAIGRRVALFVAAWLLATLPPVPATAAEGEVLTLHVRDDARQRLLILEPDGPPVAAVVLYSGGGGNVGIRKDGTIRNGGNFLVRSRALFAKQGFLVALVDRPSDWAGTDAARYRLTPAHAEDAAAVAKTLRGRTSAPIWFVGTSRGSISVANIASRLGRGLIDGAVLTSSVTGIGRSATQTVQDADLAGIAVPVLILGHGYDDCFVTPWPEQEALKNRFRGSPSVEAIRVEGGDIGDMSRACGPFSHHGFLGQEEAVVARIAEWIRLHGPRRR
jgi:hypothetical protein